MTEAMKKNKVAIVCAVLLLCITALYFSPVVFSSKTFASRDMYAFYYPRQFFAAECIKSGMLPLWNPHLASGVPFLARSRFTITTISDIARIQEPMVDNRLRFANWGR